MFQIIVLGHWLINLIIFASTDTFVPLAKG